LHLLPNATAADIQVAFATKQGVSRVLHRLRRADTARVLVSLWQLFTDPDALRLLLKTQAEASTTFHARVTLDRFHAKLYVTSRHSRLDAIVGSSNLTADGLAAPGEFSVLFSAKHGSAAARTVRSTLDRGWRAGVPLTAEIVRVYQRLRQSVTPRHNVDLSELRRLFSAGRKRPTVPTTSTAGAARRFWILSVDGYGDTTTQQIVSDATNWDRHNWDYYSCSRHRIRPGDHILVLDSTSSTAWVEVVHVTDAVRTALPTPDGRYFVACKTQRRRRRRQLTTKVRAHLKSFGIGPKHDFGGVSPRRWQELLVGLKLD